MTRRIPRSLFFLSVHLDLAIVSVFWFVFLVRWGPEHVPFLGAGACAFFEGPSSVLSCPLAVSTHVLHLDSLVPECCHPVLDPR